MTGPRQTPLRKRPIPGSARRNAPSSVRRRLASPSAAGGRPGAPPVARPCADAQRAPMLPAFHRPAPPPAWLSRIRERLDAEFAAPPGLAELAAQAGVSPRHLARAFRSHYGETIGTCVHRRRIRSAMDALLNSSERVAHIAQRSGYFDQSHFTRHFKRQTGVAPGTYRRRALGEGTDGRPAA